MPVEDKIIAMHARHACARSPLDIAELVLTCNKGVIDMTGKVKRPRTYSGGQPFNARKEFEVLKQMIRASNGVKDVLADRVEIME